MKHSLTRFKRLSKTKDFQSGSQSVSAHVEAPPNFQVETITNKTTISIALSRQNSASLRRSWEYLRSYKTQQFLDIFKCFNYTCEFIYIKINSTKIITQAYNKLSLVQREMVN